MTKILEELKTRVAESKQRLDEANKTWQAAQSNFTQATQDHNTWTMALQAEIRDEQRRSAAATEKQMPLRTSDAEAFVDVAATISDQPLMDSTETLNKTDTVRALLRRHPAGMTALEIWSEVSSQFKHRPYLYSVLKRLMDRDEVLKRRMKYCLRVATKIEDVKEQNSVVQ